jgi:peptidoglycan hydrolase-like protein with peptidoglycan-binding domain
MALTLEQLRDNLDGLGYYLSPRGLYGLGNQNRSCDLGILGNVDCSTTSLRAMPTLEAYTQSAIYQFQLDYQMAATGKNGLDLQTKLEEVVKILQNNLKIYLQSNGSSLKVLITGYYAFETLAAMKAYQASKSLPPTGIATAAVRKQLNDDVQRLLGKSPTPAPKPAPTPSPLPIPTPAPGTDVKTQLATLKKLHQDRVLTDSSFIDAVYKLVN